MSKMIYRSGNKFHKFYFHVTYAENKATFDRFNGWIILTQITDLNLRRRELIKIVTFLLAF